MKITNPELKVIRFAADDVIATSFGIMSAAAYRGSWMNDSLYHIDDGYTGYVGVTGNMTYFNDDAQGWYFNADWATELSEGEYNDIRNGSSYLTGISYDLYVPDLGYTNTQPFTKGASYYELYGNQ